MNFIIGIPVFNCENHIEGVIADIHTHCPQIPFVVLDNCSTDQTVFRARAALSQYAGIQGEVLMNDHNLGLGGSFIRLWQESLQKKYDGLILFHGDHQAQASDISKLIKEYQTKAADAVLGSRFSSNSKLTNYSRLRWMGNIFFNALFSLRTMHWIPDIGSGLNIYRLNSVSPQFIAALPTHIAFDAVLLLHYCKENKNILFAPIHWESANQKSTVKNVSVGWQLLQILWSSFKNRP